MQLAILGATGRTGLPLVHHALEGGHDVRALVRTPGKAALLPCGAERVDGDARDARVLERLVTGADVVLDVTGPVKGGPRGLRRTIMPRLLNVMEEAGVLRLVMLTGAGVRLPGDEPGLSDRAIRWVMERVAAETLADATRAVELARACDRHVTVVRAPRLVDGHRDTELRVADGVGRGHGTTLGRDDLARFLLREVEMSDHLGGAPVVSW